LDHIKNEAGEAMVDYLSEEVEKLAQARSEMSKLKKKYNFLPNTEDVGSAVKANSLQNTAFGDRIRMGGFFQLHRGNPTAVDLSPAVFYRINKLLQAGISGTYRMCFGANERAPSTLAEDVYGLGAMVQHQLWKGFFGHAAFQYMSSNTPPSSATVDALQRNWKEGLPVGIGKQIRIKSGVMGQVLFLYDVLHTSESPNPRAWNITFGITFGELKLNNPLQ